MVATPPTLISPRSRAIFTIPDVKALVSRHPEKLTIGNCDGAANHRSFIAFLISVVISCTYVAAMSIYVGYYLSSRRLSNLGSIGTMKLIAAALADSALLLSARGLVLIFLAFASLSVLSGVCVVAAAALFHLQKKHIYQ